MVIMMSIKAEEEANKDVCANCGITEIDEIKLQECNDCDLVKYCSEKCREEHREQHHEDCKRRADELHDTRLFTQPDGSHRGECPICFLPMPLEGKSTFMSCCGQMICNGCVVAHLISNMHDEVKAKTCLFCRTPASDEEEYEKRTQERIEANDPAALYNRGTKFYQSDDYDKALKYLTKAADLGDIEAHYRLGLMYEEGDCVDQDEEKSAYHYEKATIGGHPVARSALGCIEAKNGNTEIAAKHWIISANLGYEPSMTALLTIYKEGFITKEEYGATLPTYQAAVDAMKSAQRDAAEKVRRAGKLKA